MKGSCIIDGIDIYESFGAFILKGGLNSLLNFPARKDPLQNIWFEEDEPDIDLSGAYFEEKKVNIRFYIKGNNPIEYLSHYERFFKYLSQPGYRNIYIRELNSTFKLRYSDCSEFDQNNHLTKQNKVEARISIDFMMDQPTEWLSGNPSTPDSSYHKTSYFAIDNLDLARYGIIVEKAYDSFFKYPKARTSLIRKFECSNGQWVDVDFSQQKFEPKTITLECAMVTGSLSEFWNNYKYLFKIFSKKDELLELTCSATGNVSKCYYKNMMNFSKLTSFNKGNKSICKFQIDLIVINGNIPELEFLLSTEDGSFIETEDNILIDIT